MTTLEKKVRGRNKLAYVDYNGEQMAKGKNYKEYKREIRAKKKVYKNPCKHPSVMLTNRCQCCFEVCVTIRNGMVK